MLTVFFIMNMLAGLLPASECEVDRRDLVLLQTAVGTKSEKTYGRGSVWIRGRCPREAEIFYIPEEASSEAPYKCSVTLVREALPEDAGLALSAVVVNHCSYTGHSSLVYGSGSCAIIDGIKKVLTGGRYGTNGGLQPGVESWARCVPVCKKNPFSDKVILAGADQGDVYGAGALWLSYEPQGTVLCFKPKKPDYLVYRCALECEENVWPASWSGVRDAIQRFSKSGCQSYQEFDPKNVYYVSCVAQAALSGRIAGLGCMWFSWRPVSGDDDPILAQQGCRTWKGSVDEGFYAKRAAWAVKQAASGFCSWFYRSEDDMVFRYKKGLVSAPDFTEDWACDEEDGIGWLCTVREFILNSEGLA